MMVYFASNATLFGSIYGFCLGSFTGILQMIASSVKVPLLFFIPLVMCSPSLYTLNILLSTQMKYRQIVCLLLIMTYMSTVLLSSFSPIILFFILTGGTYRFTQLLNLVICGIAGLTGIGLLFKASNHLTNNIQGMSESHCNIRKGSSPNMLKLFWLLIYMFVGTQLAWGLRPFIGQSFAWYRPVAGNVYTSMYHIFFDSWNGTSVYS